MNVESVAYSIMCVRRHVRKTNLWRAAYGAALPLPDIPVRASARDILDVIERTDWHAVAASETTMNYVGALKYHAEHMPEAFSDAWKIIDVQEVMES